MAVGAVENVTGLCKEIEYRMRRFAEDDNVNVVRGAILSGIRYRTMSMEQAKDPEEEAEIAQLQYDILNGIEEAMKWEQ